jgi:hypothetical protein
VPRLSVFAKQGNKDSRTAIGVRTEIWRRACGEALRVLTATNVRLGLRNLDCSFLAVLRETAH